MAATASGIVPFAVRIITGRLRWRRWIVSNKAIPSMPGIFRSVMITCGL
jgi:hypothetical protein